MIYREEGEAGRLHLESPFAGESLQNRALIESTYLESEVPVLPTAHFVHLGGLSIMDRGSSALVPLTDEIATLRAKHDLVLTVGGGARERHVYALGSEIGFPAGALGALGWMNCEQNAIMLFHLLATRKGIEVPYLHFEMLPVYLRSGAIPILMGMPNYGMWETPSAQRRIPIHRPDTGCLLLAEVMSAKSCILLKDVDGVFDKDPKHFDDAKLLETVTAAELLSGTFEDLPVEPAALEVLLVARNVREIRVINGLTPASLSRALAGENVGTVIRQS